jgi:hypothetical protein
MRLPIGSVVIAVFAGACRCGGPVPELPGESLGRCSYTNGFSKRTECRDYFGAWTTTKIESDCRDWKGVLELGTPCDSQVRLGYCVVGGDGVFTRITFPGDDADKCGSSRTGCEVFGGGAFDPSALCGGEPEDSSLDLPVFEQPILSCRPSKEGEPLGMSANGNVCTWEMISASTEFGRDFGDYASCDRVRTQRPYYPAPTEPNAEREDPRLNDLAYAADFAWLKEQVKASACVCCHSSRAPEGPSNWFLESPGNFLNSFHGSGLAMGAGWINSVGFGTYPPEEVNGFLRPTEEFPERSIVPTTDVDRMLRIFERELAFRGLTRADFADQPYAAGPLDQQRFFRPSACADGEGVDASGTVRWRGGKARYVYVLERDAASPTVPPNLDLPQGTLWRLDVASTDPGLSSDSVTYGQPPTGARQRFPLEGAPSALVSGREYYLYVLADVAVPITRCLFAAP